MNKLIGIDVDGVLRDFPQAICNIWNKEYKTRLQPRDITHWDLRQTFKGIKTPEFYYEHGEDLFLNSKMYINSAYYMHELKEAGHEMVIVTNQPRGLEDLTIKWLNNHKIPYDGIMITKDKGLFKGDILVDDATINLNRFSSGLPICYKQPYNVDYQLTRSSTCINNLGELKRLL
jgi:5'(3')-deoxyribonucleotidase